VTDPAQEQIDAGRRVALFLEDAAIAGAFADMERQWILQWKAATVPEDREAAWQAVQSLDRLKTQLRAIVGRGQVAEHRL
jgi:hypothetical protein